MKLEEHLENISLDSLTLVSIRFIGGDGTSEVNLCIAAYFQYTLIFVNKQF